MEAASEEWAEAEFSSEEDDSNAEDNSDSDADVVTESASISKESDATSEPASDLREVLQQPPTSRRTRLGRPNNESEETGTVHPVLHVVQPKTKSISTFTEHPARGLRVHVMSQMTYVFVCIPRALHIFPLLTYTYVCPIPTCSTKSAEIPKTKHTTALSFSRTTALGWRLCRASTETWSLTR